LSGIVYFLHVVNYYDSRQAGMTTFFRHHQYAMGEFSSGINVGFDIEFCDLIII